MTDNTRIDGMQVMKKVANGPAPEKYSEECTRETKG